MKLCPYCAEEIQDAAIKCKHCHEFLGDARQNVPPTTPAARLPVQGTRRKLAPYFSPGGMAFAFCCVGPLMLPLVWLNPELSRERKIAWTVAVAVGTAVFAWIIVSALGPIIDYYRALDRLSH